MTESMFSRCFKRLLARVCVALLVMQFTAAAYACATLTSSTTASSLTTATARDSDGAIGSGCEEQLRNIGNSKVCHQHYAGDFSAGAIDFAFAPPVPEVPATIVNTVRSGSGSDITVLPALLRRATGPALSIRFQVLRI
jgi:hypothetical protein